MIDPRFTHVVAVAREGSFTAAATAVGVTQSAITKSVADLEARLGYLLFHRTSRGALLTEEGREFVERASRLLEDAKDLLQPLDKEDPYSGVLSIGICPASMEWCLIKPLTTLIARHPNIRLDVSGSTFERVVQQLRSGRLDVAVGYDEAFREWTDITRISMSPLMATMFVRKGHPILDGRKITAREISAYDFVASSETRPHGSIIRNLYEGQGTAWQKRLHTVDYFPLVESIVLKTNAIGIVAASHGKSPQFARRFQTIDTYDPFPKASLCCATRSRWEPKPAARMFIAEMRAYLASLLKE